MRSCVIAFSMVILAGCVQPTLDAAAQAERRLGRSGSDAFEAVAALASTIGGGVAPVASEAGALLASVRGRVEEGHAQGFWIGLGVVVLLIASHVVTLALRLNALHCDVRELKKKHGGIQ